MDENINALSQAIINKCSALIKDCEHQPEKFNHILTQYSVLTTDMQALSLQLFMQTDKVWQTQIDYWQEAFNLSQRQMQHWLQGKALETADAHYHSETWQKSLFYNTLLQHYLLASEKTSDLIKRIEFSNPHLAKRIQFFTQSFLDALNPALFLQTNPELQAKTFENHGNNLLQGLKQLIHDLSQNPTHFSIPMTDMNAFKVGENLATTAGFVIYKNEFMELIQYTPQTNKVRSIPLLIVPPWINKYYILDLSANNSFVAWLVKQEFSVFIISWINPDASFSKKTLYDYLEQGPITAIDVIKKQLNVKQVNTLGFCLGGTLLTCLLAYFAATNNKSIRSATLLATLIDFSEPGDISIYIDEQQINSLEKVMDKKGFLPGHMMAEAFNSLRSKDLIWSFFIKNYIEGQSPVPFDILYWNSDNTNMPATMHSEYLRTMYLQNQLIKPGQITLNQHTLDIDQINLPSFFVATQKDHIAPWQSVYQGFKAFKGDKTFLLGGSGHIAGIVNPPSKNKYGYHLNPTYENTAQEWLDHSSVHQGSWWPTYGLWLSKRSGRMINSIDLKTAMYAAPGTYVLITTEDLAS